MLVQEKHTGQVLVFHSDKIYSEKVTLLEQLEVNKMTVWGKKEPGDHVLNGVKCGDAQD